MQSPFWQQEKKRLASELEKKIDLGDESIAYASLQRLPLPEVLMISLKNLARNIFKTERPIRINPSEHFDFSDRRFKQQLAKIRDAIVEQVQFTPEDLRKTIQFTITLCFDVMTRPAQAINSMLFKDSESRPRQEVIDVLHGLGDDLYFVRALVEMLESATDEHLTKDGFETIADGLMQRLYVEHPISGMVQDLEALQGFYNEIRDAGDRKFPGELIEGMLLERRLGDYAASFQEECAEKKMWSIADTQKFLERFMLVGQLQTDENQESGVTYSGDVELESIIDEDNPPPSDRPGEPGPEIIYHLDEPVDEQQQAPLTIKIPLAPKPDADADEGEQSTDEPLQAHEANGSDSTALPGTNPTNGDPAEDEPPGRRFRGDRSFDDDSLSTIHREQIEYQPPGPYPAVEALIDRKSRALFIRKIFGKDEDAYQTFINSVQEKNSWKEAKAIFDDELAQRTISPYSREAVKLSDLLFSRYFTKGRF